ncbi:MAG: hypothetical protein M3370_07780, partial [Actinomycetota bacterium]|nr:hypothetical protein [Actinomycetota bacterium]
GSLSAGIGAIASKTAAGLAAAAIVTAGAVEVEQVRGGERDRGAQAATEPRAPSPPAAPVAAPSPAATPIPVSGSKRRERARTSQAPARDERPVALDQGSQEPKISPPDGEDTTTTQTAAPVAKVPAPVSEPPRTSTTDQPAVTGEGTSATQPTVQPPTTSEPAKQQAAGEPTQSQDAGEPVRASGSSNDGGDGAEGSTWVPRTAVTSVRSDGAGG